MDSAGHVVPDFRSPLERYVGRNVDICRPYRDHEEEVSGYKPGYHEQPEQDVTDERAPQILEHFGQL